MRGRYRHRSGAARVLPPRWQSYCEVRALLLRLLSDGCLQSTAGTRTTRKRRWLWVRHGDRRAQKVVARERRLLAQKAARREEAALLKRRRRARAPHRGGVARRRALRAGVNSRATARRSARAKARAGGRSRWLAFASSDSERNKSVSGCAWQGVVGRGARQRPKHAANREPSSLPQPFFSHPHISEAPHNTDALRVPGRLARIGARGIRSARTRARIAAAPHSLSRSLLLVARSRANTITVASSSVTKLDRRPCFCRRRMRHGSAAVAR